MKKTKQITVTIDLETYEKAVAKAKEEGRPFSNLINWVLQRFFA